MGSKLYGMTASGGQDNSSGVLFSINTDGTGYQVLLDLASVWHKWSSRFPDPLGSTLYGVTSGGGPGGASGVVFQINTDGTGYQVVHNFKSSKGDGGVPLGDLTFTGSTFYGWTYAGGSDGGGVIFSHQIPADTYPVFIPLILSN